MSFILSPENKIILYKVAGWSGSVYNYVEIELKALSDLDKVRLRWELNRWQVKKAFSQNPFRCIDDDLAILIIQSTKETIPKNEHIKYSVRLFNFEKNIIRINKILSPYIPKSDNNHSFNKC